MSQSKNGFEIYEQQVKELQDAGFKENQARGLVKVISHAKDFTKDKDFDYEKLSTKEHLESFKEAIIERFSSVEQRLDKLEERMNTLIEMQNTTLKWIIGIMLSYAALMVGVLKFFK